MMLCTLKPREDFNQLRPSCIIYICTFDPYEKGLYQYVFEEYCKQADIGLGDGTRKIFLNTKGRKPEDVSQELIHFLQYVEKSTEATVQQGNDTSIKLLHQRVKALKQRRELEVDYMWLEELLRERWNEGRAESRTEDILGFLQELGEVPEDLQAQIKSQTDPEILRQWLKTAARSGSIEEFISHM